MVFIKLLFLLIISMTIIPLPKFSATGQDSSLAHLISKKQYEQFFPHHSSIFAYENFISASKSFPLFANEGDTCTRTKELIAFLANIAHETSSGSKQSEGGRYAWGLVYVEERACIDGHCTQYNVAGTSDYQPVAGKSYHGRGPMQLSYAYNYGLAGKDLGLPLLQEPELVSTDGIIAFKTSIWFWMREQKPKPSCHNVMCGKWHPTKDDIRRNRTPGFGMAINIINGGVECNTTDTLIKAQRTERIGFYKWFASIMKISVGDDCDCAGMGSYDQ
jgi:predicted chitinase